MLTIPLILWAIDMHMYSFSLIMSCVALARLQAVWRVDQCFCSEAITSEFSPFFRNAWLAVDGCVDYLWDFDNGWQAFIVLALKIFLPLLLLHDIYMLVCETLPNLCLSGVKSLSFPPN